MKTAPKYILPPLSLPLSWKFSFCQARWNNLATASKWPVNFSNCGILHVNLSFQLAGFQHMLSLQNIHLSHPTPSNCDKGQAPEEKTLLLQSWWGENRHQGPNVCWGLPDTWESLQAAGRRRVFNRPISISSPLRWTLVLWLPKRHLFSTQTLRAHSQVLWVVLGSHTW